MEIKFYNSSFSNSGSPYQKKCFTFFIVKGLTAISIDNWNDGLLQNLIISRIFSFTPSSYNTVGARLWGDVVLGQADWLDVFVEGDFFSQTNQANIINDSIGTGFEVFVTCNFGNKIRSLVVFGSIFGVNLEKYYELCF